MVWASAKQVANEGSTSLRRRKAWGYPPSYPPQCSLEEREGEGKAPQKPLHFPPLAIILPSLSNALGECFGGAPAGEVRDGPVSWSSPGCRVCSCLLGVSSLGRSRSTLPAYAHISFLVCTGSAFFNLWLAPTSLAHAMEKRQGKEPSLQLTVNSKVLSRGAPYAPHTM